MKRLWRLVIVCSGALLLSLFGSIVIQRETPHDTILPGLNRCERIMCLYGIMPEQTAFQAAQSILVNTKEFTPSPDGSTDLIKQSSPFYNLMLIESTDACANSVNICVSELVLDFRGGADFTAGELVLEYGSPCAVQPDPILGFTYLKYPGMVMYFDTSSQAPAQRLEPEYRLEEIDIFKNFEDCDAALDDPDTLPWRGFTIYSSTDE